MTTANFPTGYRDSTEQTARAIEVPDADFTGGLNPGGSNAPGIGVCTGVADFKDTDWQVPATHVIADSQLIGKDLSGIEAIDNQTDPDNPDPGIVALVTTLGVVAIDGIIASASGFAMLNKTGAELPAGVSAWGWNTNA